MKTNTIILGLILLFLVGGISFGIGYKVANAKTKLSNFANNRAGQNGNRMGGQNNPSGGMMRGNRQTFGEVISLDDKTMTIKMPDGSSKTVLLSSTMTVNKSVEAVKTDLKVGSKVAIFGSQNTDGSQTATNIELDPKMLGQQNK